MKKVMLVFGTRPEAIKMCPLVLELRRRPEQFRTVVCVTGQHREMLDQVLRAFRVTPDHDLAVMKEQQTLFDITSAILEKLRAVLVSEKPDVVLVHGDTTTTFAAALCCFYLRIPVGHVEAGLRTYNIDSPYPEEFNREAVGVIARYNFAPTKRARENLLREGKAAGTVFVTGNTAIDALKTTVREDYRHPLLDWAAGSRLVVITAHRRENLGQPMHQMFRAIGGDRDPGIYCCIQQRILKIHLFFPARTQEMGLIGKFAFFREENGLADTILTQDDGAVPDLETADVLFSGNGERDRAVEFLFFFVMFLRKVIFHLHERAVHDPAEFDPLFLFFLFIIKDADQKRLQD